MARFEVSADESVLFESVLRSGLNAKQMHRRIQSRQPAYQFANECLVSVQLRYRGTEVGRNGFAEASWVKAGVTWLEVSLGLAGVVLPRRYIQPRETTMSPLRARMIEDMILAGLAEGTRQSYVRAVRQLTAFYRRAPDQLSEEEVRRYLLGLRQRGVARGTFQIARYGLQFFYCHTLGRVWELFGEKKDRLAAAEAAA